MPVGYYQISEKRLNRFLDVVSRIDTTGVTPEWRELNEACERLGIAVEPLPFSAIDENNLEYKIPFNEDAVEYPYGVWRLATNDGISVTLTCGVSSRNFVDWMFSIESLPSDVEAVHDYAMGLRRLRGDSKMGYAHGFLSYLMGTILHSYNGFPRDRQPEFFELRHASGEHKILNDDPFHAYLLYAPMVEMLSEYFSSLPFGTMSGMRTMLEGLDEFVDLLSCKTMSVDAYPTLDVPLMLPIGDRTMPIEGLEELRRLDIGTLPDALATVTKLIYLWSHHLTLLVKPSLAGEFELIETGVPFVSEIAYFDSVREKEDRWIEICEELGAASILEAAAAGVPVEDLLA